MHTFPTEAGNGVQTGFVQIMSFFLSSFHSFSSVALFLLSSPEPFRCLKETSKFSFNLMHNEIVQIKIGQHKNYGEKRHD